ncbi:MAG TPA: tetratricopeptide repeat protein [Sediminibacterium sp.]|nr:tetratricopeptide repeat protein [Sediminibacterium sp.]
MIIKTITTCGLLLAILTGSAQNKSSIKPIVQKDTRNKVSFACNFFGSTADYQPVSAASVTDENAEKWMSDIVTRITGVVGLRNRFRLVALQNFNNCAAVCFNNETGQDRFIQFDRQFLENFQKKTANKWFVTGVLAHELGHHFNGHSLDGIGSRPDKEIEADEFAGFILQKLGAKEDEAVSIFSFLNETDGPPTHPVKSKRYAAVSRGWNSAAGNTIWVSLLLENDADKKEIAYEALMAARNETDAGQKLALIDKALKKIPAYAEAISEKGLVYLQQKQYREAAQYCKEALVLEPYIGILRLNLAKVLMAEQQYDSAYSFIQDAIFLKPVFPEAYHQRALLFLGKKSYTQAANDCGIALLMNPDNPATRADILITKGIAHNELNQEETAVACFTEAEKLDPYNKRIAEYRSAKK